MGLLLIMVIAEVFTPAVLRQHLFVRHRALYYIALIIHITLSSWQWLIFLKISGYNSFYDNPQHIWLLMNMNGMLVAVTTPRIILILCHYAGRIIRHHSGDYIKWLTNTGFAIMGFIFLTIAASTLHGRFNFKTEAVTINIKDLHDDLDGIKIIQLSDMHLAGFYHHRDVLQKVMDEVNSLDPDIIVNTGDFVSYGWREFDRHDTIISKARSRYGNYAVLGNHDFGTYHPYFTEADKENNILIINNMVEASGYMVLNDEFTLISIGSAKIGMIGIITVGRHPDIKYGDLGSAVAGLDSVDLKILLSHDPNHWKKEVTGKTDINLTLSGHTHGMQMGLLTNKYRWSPSKYFYPNWNGLYTEGEQFQYVNRGLGVLSIPFRIWMPPEITVITLRKQ